MLQHNKVQDSIGSLREHVIIERLNPLDDQEGGWHEEWRPFAKVWAKIDLIERGLKKPGRYQFMVRDWGVNLDPDRHRINWRGRFLRLQQIKIKDPQLGWLEITAIEEEPYLRQGQAS